MPGQLENSKALGQVTFGQRPRVAGLRQQKFMPQLPEGVSAVQKRRLQQGMVGEIAFNPRRKDGAAGLLLQVLTAADVVGVYSPILAGLSM